MKVWKKNLVAAAVLITVCAGIYVNWLYTEKEDAVSLSDTLDYEKVMSEDGLLLTEDVAAITAGEEPDTPLQTIFPPFGSPGSRPGTTRSICSRRQ